jgi:apolipoprotein N-acyltransferase
MNWHERPWFGILAALLTGGLFLCSRDVGPAGPLVLVAPIAVLIFALSSPRAWPVGLAAFAAGAIGASGLIYAYGAIFPPMVLVTWIAGQGLWYLAIVLLTRWLARRLSIWLAILTYPLFATATEFAFSLVSPHGSFGAIGYGLVDLLPLLQAASIGGVAMLSFIAALVPMALAMLVVAPADWRKVAIVAGIPLALICAFGFARLATNADAQVRVALAAIDSLQADDEPGEAHTAEAAKAYADLVRGFAAERPDIVVLPEKEFGAAAGSTDAAAAQLSQAAGEIAATLVAGFNEVQPDGARLNLALVFPPLSSPVRYQKRRLVPGLEADFIPGDAPLVIGDLGIAICKDMDFAPMIREYGRRNVRLMLVPAWDFVADGRLHARMAVVRGVENGFAVARAAAMGRLTVSDAYGRVVAEATTSEQAPATLVADVDLGPGATPYVRLGDAFGWLTIFGAITLAVVGLLPRGRQTRRVAA